MPFIQFIAKIFCVQFLSFSSFSSIKKNQWNGNHTINICKYSKQRPSYQTERWWSLSQDDSSQVVRLGYYRRRWLYGGHWAYKTIRGGKLSKRDFKKKRKKHTSFEKKKSKTTRFWPSKKGKKKEIILMTKKKRLRSQRGRERESIHIR